MKITKYILIISLIALAITMIACDEETPQENTQEENTTNTDLEGTCNTEKGETYCPSLNECIQVWLEKCPEYKEYYREPTACTMEYAPVKGDIVFPCDEGECTTTLEFGNECVAKAQGATNIKPIQEEPLLGGDEDEYGCIPSAGYTWCPSLDECIRVWETKCPEYEEYYREPTACTKEYMPVLGEITMPKSDDEEITIEKKFGNRCEAEAAGATNIQDINKNENEVTNFEECKAKGNPIMESHPRQCEHKGTIYTETI